MPEDSASHELTEALRETAAGPAAVTIDGQTVTTQKVGDIIKAKHELAAEKAASKKHRGLRFTKIVLPGSSA